MMARGRPRKAGPRHASGGLRFVPDRGSPELLIRRVLDLHPELEGLDVERLLRRNDTDDRRASYPLGVLYARSVITGPQHYAGRRYAGLFVRAVRGIGVPSILADLAGRGSIAVFNVFTETVAQGAAEVRTAYLDAREMLDRSGSKAARSVDDVAVYEIWPVEVRALKIGLEALRDHFETQDKRARAA